MRADCRVEYAGKARLVERDEEVAGATLEVDESRELLGRERAQRTSFEEDVDRRGDEASRNVGRALRVLGRVARDRRCEACGDASSRRPSRPGVTTGSTPLISTSAAVAE